MLRLAGRVTLASVMAGALALGGCATTESVEKAQATADQAMSAAQSAGAAAQHAQSSADAASAAAQRAQSSADAAASSAQAAASQAQAAAAQASGLDQRVQTLETQHKAPAKHRRRHKGAASGAGERG